MGDQIIRCGDADIIVAGGMESMSNAPYLLKGARWGLRMGDDKVVDLMVHDGLWCAFHNIHMAVHGSTVAKEYGISRQEQDEWTLRSQTLAARAIDEGRLKDEIIPVAVPQKKGGPCW
jgi:acetyl-CoA C-acetyltransferase